MSYENENVILKYFSTQHRIVHSVIVILVSHIFTQAEIQKISYAMKHQTLTDM
jgi:hypothetical protein